MTPHLTVYVNNVNHVGLLIVYTNEMTLSGTNTQKDQPWDYYEEIEFNIVGNE